MNPYYSDSSEIDYRDLWIVDLNQPTASAALLGEARRMADSLGAYVHYLGAMETNEAIAYGADRVHPLTVDSGDAAVSALASFFTEHPPEFILGADDELTNEVLQRLAGKLKSNALIQCNALRLDESLREIIATHPVYEGAYFLESAITTKPQIFTVQANVFPEGYADSGRSGEVENFEAITGTTKVRALGEVANPLAVTPLRRAAKIIAVGNKGNDEASVKVAQEIAQKVDAAFAGDRSAFDAKWIGYEQIVGVVGTEVAPDIYVAAGIWGDTLHRAGVENAKYMIAIHPDKHAPIFQYADACVIGEPKEVLPKLLAQL